MIWRKKLLGLTGSAAALEGALGEGEGVGWLMPLILGVCTTAGRLAAMISTPNPPRHQE